MTFGYCIAPQVPQTFRVTCRDCSNCHLCACGAHGFCTELMEFIDPDESFLAWEECEAFEPNNADCIEETDFSADIAYDLAVDREMEEE